MNSLERGCSVLCAFADTSYPAPDTLVVTCRARGYAQSARVGFAHSNPQESVMDRRCIAPEQKTLTTKPFSISEEDWKKRITKYYSPGEPFGGVDPFAIGDDESADEI